MRQGRGQSLARTIQRLNPLLRGWANYFSLSVQHKRMKELDGWLRRRLRCLLWRQWKRPRTRRRYLLAQGLSPERAWKSSVNGRGPWWNAGASHMQQAYPNAWFQRLGLVSIHETVVRLVRPQAGGAPRHRTQTANCQFMKIHSRELTIVCFCGVVSLTSR